VVTGVDIASRIAQFARRLGEARTDIHDVAHAFHVEADAAANTLLRVAQGINRTLRGVLRNRCNVFAQNSGGFTDTGCVEAVLVAGKAVKFNGKLIDEALVRRARRLAAESGDYLFEKAGMAISAELRGRKS